MAHHQLRNWLIDWRFCHLANKLKPLWTSENHGNFHLWNCYHQHAAWLFQTTPTFSATAIAYFLVFLCVQNIDLHALTGWIPERVAIRRSSTGAEEEFNAEREFQRIRDRFHKGHCLVTVATGELRDGEADRTGLVPTHAYAMLDVQLIQVWVYQLYPIIPLDGARCPKHSFGREAKLCEHYVYIVCIYGTRDSWPV